MFKLYRIMSFLAPVLAIIGFLLIWKIYVVISGVSRFLLPAPEAMILAAITLLGEMQTWHHIWTTVAECVGGFVLALVFGIAFGTLIAKSPVLERAFQPIIVMLQVLPKIALVPLFVLWFGFGIESKIIIAAVIGVFPILINTQLGIKSVEAGHREVMKTLNAGSWKTFYLLEVPSALPFILGGMEIGIVLTTIGAVVGEFLAGGSGLGHLAVMTLQELEVDRLFGIILLLTILGFVLYYAIVLLRKVAIPWHQSEVRLQ